MRLFQAALDTCLDQPPSLAASQFTVCTFTVYAPSKNDRYHFREHRFWTCCNGKPPVPWRIHFVEKHVGQTPAEIPSDKGGGIYQPFTSIYTHEMTIFGIAKPQKGIAVAAFGGEFELSFHYSYSFLLLLARIQLQEIFLLFYCLGSFA